MDAGYKTPKGNAHWWSAQVRQLLEGRFDDYYGQSSQVPLLRDGFRPDRRALNLVIDRESWMVPNQILPAK
jgi:hypothetical protein